MIGNSTIVAHTQETQFENGVCKMASIWPDLNVINCIVYWHIFMRHPANDDRVNRLQEYAWLDPNELKDTYLDTK